MPTYPVINLKTKETKELSMTMAADDEWRKDPENVDWDKDWSAGVAGVGEVGDWQQKLKKSIPGWNEVLARAAQQPGATVKPID